MARDEDGFYNAFIVKPRRIKGVLSNYWTTMHEPIWSHIPPVFINLLDDKIKNMTWEDEPIEVSFYVLKSEKEIDEAAKKYQEKIEETNPAAEAFGFDMAFREGANYILKT